MSRASVSVDGRLVSEIGPGLLVLVGIASNDLPAQADYLVDKLVNLRIFPDGGVSRLRVHGVVTPEGREMKAISLVQ